MRLAKFALLIGILLIFSVPMMAQGDACGEIGGVMNEAGDCTLTKRVNYTISYGYPVEVARYPNFKQAVDEFLSTREAEFMMFAQEFYSADFDEYPYTMDITYSITSYGADIQSILFSIYEFTGGAHGNLYFHAITYDVANDMQIEFLDLFQEEFNPLWTISPIVQESLLMQLEDMSDADWIADGTGDEVFENYQNFVVTDEALVFHFPPYQVAPYAAGPQSVSIPWADINVVLAPPFLDLSD